MTKPFQWPLPSWLADLPEKERDDAYNFFLLELVRIYSGPRATAREFSLRLGYSEHVVYNMKKVGTISPEMAMSIEKLMGRELFPRELFRPDYFALPTE